MTNIKKDDVVELVKKPEHFSDKDAPLTIGGKYLCIEFTGKSAIIATDHPHLHVPVSPECIRLFKSAPIPA